MTAIFRFTWLHFFQEQGEVSVAGGTEITSVARPPTQTTTVQAQQIPQRVENIQKELTTTAANPVSSSTAKIRPRMQQPPSTAMENMNGFDHSKRSSDSASPPSNHLSQSSTSITTDDDTKQINGSGPTVRSDKGPETKKMVSPFSQHDAQIRDQKLAHNKPTVSNATVAGSVIRAGTNTTIPVAVVVPNAQPKPPR